MGKKWARACYSGTMPRGGQREEDDRRKMTAADKWVQGVDEHEGERARERAGRKSLTGRSSGLHVGLSGSVKLPKYIFALGRRKIKAASARMVLGLILHNNGLWLLF